MKKMILLGSVGAALISTTIGILAVYTQNGFTAVESLDGAANVVQSSVQLYQVAGMFGLLSIATFFVGWAYPTETITTYSPTSSVTKIA